MHTLLIFLLVFFIWAFLMLFIAGLFYDTALRDSLYEFMPLDRRAIIIADRQRIQRQLVAIALIEVLFVSILLNTL